MPRTTFEFLPAGARLWVFPSARALAPEEETYLLSIVDDFLDGWAAHGTPLTAARDWRHGRFLLVAVDEATAPPSGCSIDAMVRVLKDVKQEMGIDLLDHAPVWFTEGGEVRRVGRTEFRSLVEEGRVSLETPVFDNTVTRKSQVDEGAWEKPAGASWHRRAFFREGAEG